MHGIKSSNPAIIDAQLAAGENIDDPMETPRLEIDLKKIYDNTKFIVNLFKTKNVEIAGITKVVQGNPSIANTMVQAGVRLIGDSRIENIKRMREACVASKFALVRAPILSKADQVVAYSDISLNSEIKTIKALSACAKRQNKIHQVILMVELGDLREGVLPGDLESIVYDVLKTPNIELVGLGTNLGCYGGVVPEKTKMETLSDIAQSVEDKFDIQLDIISGGNSYNLDWFNETNATGRINNLRIGELIFFGWNTLTYKSVAGLKNDAFTLVSEVIESKIKGSIPSGKINCDAFGNVPTFENRGMIRRSILGIGRQDVLVSGLTAFADIDILGSSSDHIIVDAKANQLCVGDEVRFHLNYGALLAAMTSSYVAKVFVHYK